MTDIKHKSEKPLALKIAEDTDGFAKEIKAMTKIYKKSRSCAKMADGSLGKVSSFKDCGQIIHFDIST